MIINNKLKRLEHITIIICFIFFLAISYMSFITDKESKYEIAKLIVKQNRNNIITKNIRDTLVNIDNSYQKHFYKIQFIDTSGLLLFQLPTTANNLVLSSIIKIPIYWDNNNVNHEGTFIFIYDNSKMVSFIIILTLVSYLVFYLIFKKVRKGIIKSYHSELEQKSKTNFSRNATEVIHNIKKYVQILEQKEKDNKNMLLYKNIYLNIQKIISRSISLETEPTSFAYNKQSIVMIDEVLTDSYNSISKQNSCKVCINIKYKNIYTIAERDNLENVFLNVLNNALDATKDISKPEIKINSTISNNIIVILIHDNGIGIEKDQISEIFEAKKSFNKKNGTGYGLYHVKQSIHKLGGSISVISDKEIGTEFILNIPIKPITILYLEDDPLIRSVWEETFKPNNINLILLTTKEELNKYLKNANESFYFFIDSYLGNDISGEEIILELSEKHFSNLYLTTAKEKEDICPKVLKSADGIIGKSPEEALAILSYNSEPNLV